jgi:predicted ATPase
MIVSRIKLKNWKNFKEADIELDYRAFIVGANASGKSNLIDVVRFLRDIVKQAGGLQYAVNDVRGGVKKIRCLAAKKDSEVSVEVHLSDEPSYDPEWIYKVSFKNIGGGIRRNETLITEEKVWSKEKNGYLLERPFEGEDDENRKFTHLEQITSNTEFRNIYHFFQEIQYLHLVPQLVREADSFLISANKEDFYGRNLLERMSKTPTKTRNAYFKKINEVLQIAVPQLKELKLENDKMGIPHLGAVYEHWRAKGAKQQETQFSDGTLRLIGFMWALLDGTETILLEEPELYLHTAIVKQLPEFISQLQRRKGRIRQVLITTHSFDLLSGSGIGLSEVIVLEPSKEGTKTSVAKDLEDVRKYLEAGFSMAEAVIPKVAPKKIDGMLQLKIWD